MVLVSQVVEDLAVLATQIPEVSIQEIYAKETAACR